MLGIRNPEQGRKQMISQNIRKNKGHVHYKYLIFHSTEMQKKNHVTTEGKRLELLNLQRN